jgi:hypothetical protein
MSLHLHSFVIWLLAISSLLKSSEAINSYFELAGARDRAEAGEKALEAYKERAENSVCWKGAVARLDAGCRALSDVSQSKLAIAFTNCHLAKSGKPTYPCTEKDSIADCTRDMDIIAFQAYTEFFTHTGHICFFLQSQLWQEKTELAVSRLTENSETVSNNLQESLNYHKQLIEYEKLSLDNQQVLLTADKELKDLTEKLQTSFREMNQTSSEVFGDLFSWLKKIAAFQSLALGEFMSIKTILFYSTAIILAYVLTTTPRTSEARFWIYAILVMTFGLERLFLSVFLGGTDGSSTGVETLHWLYWWLRNGSVVLCLTVLVYQACIYRDYSRENYQLLNYIKEKMERFETREGLATIKDKQPVVTMALSDSSSPVSKAVTPSSSTMRESTDDSDSVFTASDSRRLSELLEFPDGSVLECDKAVGSRNTNTADNKPGSSDDKTVSAVDSKSTQKEDKQTPMLSSNHQSRV